ncbi:DNA (cytosine-5-)-methyltransferase [Faecalibaculum rodentium]|uniref:DNA (cytosine-5-)-methyltransferase n=1 Tax=Faecalibaculum rodentium TaxID=1702221 RepID=UPI0023F1EE62|nr:DNA (cytosine-5-)-methyltransferase [Faecalibaculum rodentium]
MLRLVEAFSGIGSQAKALENTGIPFETVMTVEWDINAILAYCLIHKKTIDTSEFENLSDEEVTDYLSACGLSNDSKQPMNDKALALLSPETRLQIYAAIKNTNNLVDIKKVHGEAVPEDTDVFVYSFPCQDLSAARFWQKKAGGIRKEDKTRSGMLWEIERILSEMKSEGRKLPRILLMENVPAITGSRYSKDFGRWKHFLEKLGYINQSMVLDARNFGIPQGRERYFMVSVFTGDNEELQESVRQFYRNNNLEDRQHGECFHRRELELKDLLRTDYSNPIYRQEAIDYQPNETPSRHQIFLDNPLIYRKDGTTESVVATITTKQDRNPNSGLVYCEPLKEGKPEWRYLTSRECFMLMGFDEEDYERIASFKRESPDKKGIFSNMSLDRMAGNSIVVDVLEEIFLQFPAVREMQDRYESPKSVSPEEKEWMSSFFPIFRWSAK